MSLNQSIVSAQLQSSLARSNQTLSSVVDQLEGLTLNKFCQNRWVYHQGTCYYFSKAQVLPKVSLYHPLPLSQETASWAEAGVQCHLLHTSASLAMPKSAEANTFLAEVNTNLTETGDAVHADM